MIQPRIRIWVVGGCKLRNREELDLRSLGTGACKKNFLLRDKIKTMGLGERKTGESFNYEARVGEDERSSCRRKRSRLKEKTNRPDARTVTSACRKDRSHNP